MSSSLLRIENITGQMTKLNAVTVQASNVEVSGAITGKKAVSTELNVLTNVAKTLLPSESGSIFLVKGTSGTKVVTLPAASVKNVGLTYEFFITETMTTNFQITSPVNGSILALTYLILGSASNALSNTATSLTLPSPAINSRVSLTCVLDDGTGALSTAIWKTEGISDVAFTITP